MPTEHYHEIEEMTFGAIDKYDVSLISNVTYLLMILQSQTISAFLRENPYIRPELAEKTFGLIYDLKSGKLEAIEH